MARRPARWRIAALFGSNASAASASPKASGSSAMAMKNCARARCAAMSCDASWVSGSSGIWHGWPWPYFAIRQGLLRTAMTPDCARGSAALAAEAMASGTMIATIANNRCAKRFISRAVFVEHAGARGVIERRRRIAIGGQRRQKTELLQRADLTEHEAGIDAKCHDGFFRRRVGAAAQAQRHGVPPAHFAVDGIDRQRAREFGLRAGVVFAVEMDPAFETMGEPVVGVVSQRLVEIGLNRVERRLQLFEPERGASRISQRAGIVVHRLIVGLLGFVVATENR